MRSKKRTQLNSALRKYENGDHKEFVIEVNEEIKSNNTFRKDVDLIKLNETNFENKIACVEERDDLIAILLEEITRMYSRNT